MKTKKTKTTTKKAIEADKPEEVESVEDATNQIAAQLRKMRDRTAPSVEVAEDDDDFDAPFDASEGDDGEGDTGESDGFTSDANDDDLNEDVPDIVTISYPYLECGKCLHLFPERPKGKYFACTDHQRCPAASMVFRFFPVDDEEIDTAISEFIGEGSDPDSLLSLFAEIAELGDDVNQLLTRRIRERMLDKLSDTTAAL